MKSLSLTVIEMKVSEQYFTAVLKSSSVTIQLKATEQCFPVKLFIVLY